MSGSSFNHAIGSSGSDNLDAGTTTNEITLDGGSSAIGGVDLLSGSSTTGKDTFVLANTARTYYGTTPGGQVTATQSATNYAQITNFAANSTLVLNRTDLGSTGGPGGVAWGNYSFGAAVNGDFINGDETHAAHFGFYDLIAGQNMLIADIQAQKVGTLGPISTITV